jgi:hypothetical protein
MRSKGWKLHATANPGQREDLPLGGILFETPKAILGFCIFHEATKRYNDFVLEGKKGAKK